jgi:NADPH-dependent ferric siderophore reductase
LFGEQRSTHTSLAPPVEFAHLSLCCIVYCLSYTPPASETKITTPDSTTATPIVTATPASAASTVTTLKKANNNEIERPYTPLHHDSSSFDLVVKTYEHGIVSRYLYGLSIGDMIKVMGPAGGYTYSRGQYKHLCIIAAGTGIAPLYQLMRHVVNDDHDTNTRITLLYANRRSCDRLLLNELQQLTLKLNQTTTTTTRVASSNDIRDVATSSRLVIHHILTSVRCSFICYRVCDDCSVVW